MRKVLFALALTLVLPAAAQAAVVFNPQLQVNASNFSTEDADSIQDEARAGFGLGGFVRFGSGRAFFQPGVFYQETTINLVDETVTLNQLEDELGVTSFWIPATLGIYIIQSETFNLRGTAGPAATIVTDVKDNPFGLEKEDYEDVVFGGVLGIGADFWIVTADLSYELGFSNVFDQNQPGLADAEAKQNTWRFGAGLRFP